MIKMLEATGPVRIETMLEAMARMQTSDNLLSPPVTWIKKIA